MFYPVDSLKRGGRFYLCWVADSWPLRFANLTPRQLWSQDIRRICDELQEVITKESGRPTQRFSLRLSSQLMRGLVRLFQRKVNVFLGDLCMIQANVFKISNKRWNIEETEDDTEQVRRPLPRLDIQEVIQEPPEIEQRIEELIRASGNAVQNIDDITLREPVAQESNMLLRPDDGFGEELQDRTMEFLLYPNVSRALSAGDMSRVSTDMSRDKSRLRIQNPHVESIISEHDITMLNKGMAEELMPEIDKDIPDISEILPPEISIPLPEISGEVQQQPAPEKSKFVQIEPPKEPELAEIELEELEDVPTKRRRLRQKLIIDKRTKINTKQFRMRLENPLVETRCHDSIDDVISIRVPPELYFRRSSKGGSKIAFNVGFQINHLFVRNLGVISTQPREERDIEEIMSRRRHAITHLENIDEEPEVPSPSIQQEQLVTIPVPAEQNVTDDHLNISRVPPVIVENMDLDISEMLTQKIETISQERKRKAEQKFEKSPKKPCTVGTVSFGRNRSAKNKSRQDAGKSAELEADKENRNVNLPPSPIQMGEPRYERDAQRMVSSLLQGAGLADIPAQVPATAESQEDRADGAETPLGSLDRTKVSLGDSDHTTDTQKFIRSEWGTEGTMLKILRLAKFPPVTMAALTCAGPVLPGLGRIVAARAFSSVLKLKQHGFINVSKDPETLVIKDITLGPLLISRTISQEQL